MSSDRNTYCGWNFCIRNFSKFSFYSLHFAINECCRWLLFESFGTHTICLCRIHSLKPLTFHGTIKPNMNRIFDELHFQLFGRTWTYHLMLWRCTVLWLLYHHQPASSQHVLENTGTGTPRSASCVRRQSYHHHNHVSDYFWIVVTCFDLYDTPQGRKSIRI